MTERTPVEQLEDGELCERTAEAMGWEKEPSHPRSYYSEGHLLRYIPSDDEWEDPDIRPTPRWLCFRPDLDGNHLAEVIAEIKRRGWNWGFDSDNSEGADGRAQIQEGAHPYRLIEDGYGNFNEALLRAFVAASEAEKGRGS